MIDRSATRAIVIVVLVVVASRSRVWGSLEKQMSKFDEKMTELEHFELRHVMVGGWVILSKRRTR